MKFITYAELNQDIIENLYKLPRNIDLIVGVPRSGIMVASIIALYLNKPLTDLDSFLNMKIYSTGTTKNLQNIITNVKQAKKILIVDDTVSSGRALQNVKRKINDAKIDTPVYYFSPYIRTESANLVDNFIKIIDDKRVFEWNYMHNDLLQHACVDIDGVLCVDPSESENDDGINYINFLLTAKPKLIPTKKIGYIVTSRLEKYRKETEEWLQKNHIEYENLIMMNLSTAEERRLLNNHGEFKATIYKKLKDAYWFIESDSKQAEIIYQYTGKGVFCVENQYFYNEKTSLAFKSHIKYSTFAKLKRNLKSILPKPILNIIKYIKSKIKKL